LSYIPIYNQIITHKVPFLSLTASIAILNMLFNEGSHEF